MADRPAFPWTPDQLQRYSFLREAVAGLNAGRPVRLLDVGGAAPNRDGSLGWLPAAEIFGEPGAPEAHVVVLDRYDISKAGYVRGDGRSLPFGDRTFDIVSALDVLEHVPGGERLAFLREMVRVSAGLVIVAGPRADDAVREAERSLARKIRDRYGFEHVQLAEHETNGLISDNATRDALESAGTAVTSIGFGSLAGWTESQGRRSLYLMRRGTPEVMERLDAWLVLRGMAAEFEPPFYRMFWLASKTRSRADLDDLTGLIRGRLQARPAASAGALDERQKAFEVSVREMEGGGILSALVISRGNEAALAASLRHLTTQEVDFDLEAAVWGLEEGGAEAKRIRERFPSVRFLMLEPAVPLPEAWRKTVAGLRGEAILLIDEDVRLPARAAMSLFGAMRENPAPGVWAWRVSWKKLFTQARSSKNFPWTKAAAGRIPRWKRGSEILIKPKGGWIYSRCLLLSREAIAHAERSPRRDRRQKRPGSLFLWD